MLLEVRNSPFSEEQVELLNRLLPALTEGQKIWLNGYLTALHGAAGVASAAVALQERPNGLAAEVQVKQETQEVTVLYGSQTGNCQRLAEQISQKLEAQQCQVTLAAMNDFKANTLKNVKTLLIIVSTHGEGDPPDNGVSFHEYLHSRRAPKLADTQYAVLALGDSSYEFFCKTGQDFDQRLAELGATPLCPRVDCDLDYDEPAAAWMDSVLASLREQGGGAVGEAAATFTPIATDVLAEQAPYSRSKPYVSEVFENINLNGRGSNQETRHLELSLEGANLNFEPGDSIGIYPDNDPGLVEQLLSVLHYDSDELVPLNSKGETGSLKEALSHHYEITVLSKPLLEKFAAWDGAEAKRLQELVAPGQEQALRDYVYGRDLLDLVRDFGPWEVSAAEFVAALRKIPPRLYSIASSLKAYPEEVHLTIRTLRYEAHGRERNGVCSIQCATRVQAGDTLPIFVQQNPNFRLPSDSNQPIIMIGPGTGVAPFRSFLQEREENGDTGKSWLFFGDQHFATDFLYQLEFQRWLKDGVLTQMDVAFSRDSAKKVYVQHRMLEKSREVFQWLEEGAVVYVCGDEKRMAADVHATLQTIISQEGGMDATAAAVYLADMQQQKRYQRDVY